MTAPAIILVTFTSAAVLLALLALGWALRTRRRWEVVKRDRVYMGGWSRR